MFDEHGVAECPTCHTPSTQLTAQVTAHKAEMTKLVKEVEALTIAWQGQLKIENFWKDWETREKDRLKHEQKLDAAEQSLQAIPAPAATEDELQQAVGDYEQFQQVKQEILPLAQQARENKAKLAGMLTGIKDRRQQLETNIKTATVTKAAAYLAQNNLTQRKALLTTRAELSDERSQLLFDMKRLEEQRDLAEQQTQTAVKLRSWTGVAESAREALKTAPRLVAQRNLQRLESAINELLQIFRVNFVVKVATDGTPTFIAEFFDGRRQVAQRLSIGQKTVLALAFRVAVNAMFAEEIGLLALDEPTASLDQPRIQALAPVLEKLRDLSTAKGLQCLLVTHAANLSHLFESTIELEAPELRHGTRAG